MSKDQHVETLFNPFKPIVLRWKLFKKKDRWTYGNLTNIIEIKSKAKNVFECKINPVLKDRFFPYFRDKKGTINICFTLLKKN